MMWLREQVPLTEDFEECGKVLKSLVPMPKEKVDK
jgi:hypothetical protein